METAITISNQPNEIQLAMQSTMVRNCGEIALNNTVVKAIAKAAQYCGQVITKEDAAFISRNLCDVVTRHYPNVRVDEIPVAIERGVLGDFGEYFGLNVASFTKFIKAYMESQVRIEAAKKLLDVSKDEPKIPSPEELRVMENDIIVNAYSTFCESGSFYDAGNHVYNKLDERGLIPFTAEVKRGFMDKAKTTVELRNNPSTATSLDERRKRAQFIESLAKGLKSAESAIIREAKQIALNEYFSGLKEMETDIKLLLEEQNDD